jgi:dipeptidyl aminopeptidase/acylaminoacyl peptidase
MPIRRAALLSVLLATIALTSLPAIAADRTHDIEPDDYFTLGVLSNCVMSPDGSRIAYTESRWDKEADQRNRDIWVVDAKSEEVKRLTFDPQNDGQVSWSPDGKHVYFTSGRNRAGEEKPPYDGEKQVWRISPDGGTPFAVTRVKDGILDYELSHDGRSLYYTVADEVVADDFKEMREKHDHLEYGHGVVEYTQIWKLDLASWKAEKLVDDNRVIKEFAASPDGARIAMITTPDNNLITNEGWSRVDIHDVKTGAVTVMTEDGWRSGHPSPYGWVEGLAWAADSSALAFSISFDGHPSEMFAAEWQAGAATFDMLERPDEVDIASADFRWRGDTRDLCFVGESHGRKRLCALQSVRSGSAKGLTELTPGDVVVGSFGFDRAGDDLAVILSTTTHTGDIFHGRIGQTSENLRRITHANQQVDTWKLPQISVVRFPGADGDDVEAILELPPDYKPADGPLPMIVEIHGGPTSATMYHFRLWIYGRALMASKGYALLSVNYHGSTGYGRSFMTKLIGRENDIEVEDILKGVDAMVDRGIADPERLGVMGWSNGGYLTNCLITRTDRFKAASSGAGVLDMVIQWGSEDTPGHVINYTQGLPWSKPDAYRHASPIYALDKVKTPTLIHVGGSDPRCPPAHSKALYRALRFYVDVPTELVIYPGEPHGLMKYKNRKAKMLWDLAWFERHILGSS